jgi:hypothetical protein
MFQRFIVLLVTAVMLLAPAGTGAQEIKVFVLTPPEVVLAGVKKLAVLDLQGQGGDALSNLLIELLMDDTRGLHEVKSGIFGRAREGRTLQDGARTNVFELVERSRLYDVLREQRLGQSGIVDDAQAAHVGKVLGVDAVLNGTLTFGSTDKSWRGTRTVKRDGQTAEVPVSCLTREVKAVARIRVTHAESGRILATTEKGATKKDDECEPSLGSIASPSDLLGPALGEIASALADHIAPRFELQDFGLKRVRGKEAESLAKKAGDLAKDLNVDEAYVIYKSLYDNDPYTPELSYNVAVLNEVVGNHRSAAEFYGAACELKDERDCRRGAERTAKGQVFQEALAALGVEIVEHEFRIGEADVARATAKTLEIRGSRDQRVGVLAEPREGSESVAAVPGGVTFTITAEEGAWYRIRLPGGKEGYVHRDKVKVSK